MSSNLWIGVIAGAAGTLVVLGGVAVVTAAGGDMGAMSMDAMMEQCRQMMSSHSHG